MLTLFTLCDPTKNVKAASVKCTRVTPPGGLDFCLFEVYSLLSHKISEPLIVSLCDKISRSYLLQSFPALIVDSIVSRLIMHMIGVS